MKKFLMLALVATSFGLLGANSAAAATGNHCHAAVSSPAQTTAPVATTAQAPGAQVRRSFSVEPGIAPAYRAPAMRSYRSSGSTNSAWSAGRKILGKYEY